VRLLIGQHRQKALTVVVHEGNAIASHMLMLSKIIVASMVDPIQ